MKKLVVITNEKIYENDNSFYCNNLDIKSTCMGLERYFDIFLVGRSSKNICSHKINLKDVRIFKNTLSIFNFFSFLRKDSYKFLIISLTPFTLFLSLLLKTMGKKSYLYLRSDGFGEYKSIFGFIGPIIYYFLFSIGTRISSVISCRDYILRGKKGTVITPSQLTSLWLSANSNNNSQITKLLYVGRLKKEKGIFNLIKMMKNKSKFVSLTIVGKEKNDTKNIYEEGISILDIETDEKRLIKIYDEHNIFVLPSYTEGQPMVIHEALARKRPIIIFNEIKHVVQGRKGIFVSDRNSKSFFEKVEYINNNYDSIQNEMKSNKLPLKDDFLSDISKIINI